MIIFERMLIKMDLLCDDKQYSDSFIACILERRVNSLSAESEKVNRDDLFVMVKVLHKSDNFINAHLLFFTIINPLFSIV